MFGTGEAVTVTTSTVGSIGLGAADSCRLPHPAIAIAIVSDSKNETAFLAARLPGEL
jgi:hypothetical protein